MKKNGFTLAEVLITLAIIGVVASLTLPALITNTQEQQAVTAFRKAVNTLSEAGQMSAAQDGFDYSGLQLTMTPGTDDTLDTNGVTKQALWAMLSNRTNVDKVGSGSVKLGGECATKYTSQILFMDGTALCYEDKATGTLNANSAYIEGYIDTNGVKAPNKAFECTTDLCKPSDRKVGDQFPVTLKGASVIPSHITVSDNGNIKVTADNKNRAAQWAMRK